MVGIGFFAPLPLALMLPFMAGQSMIMGEAFGKAYQYGKRRISSMSNADFNKLTAKKLSVELATDYTDMLPALSMAIKKSEKFQQTVIDAMLKIPIDTLNNLFGSPNPSGSSNIGGIGTSALTATGGTSTSNLESGLSGFLSGLGNFFQSFDPKSGKTIIDYLGAVQDVKSGKTTIRGGKKSTKSTVLTSQRLQKQRASSKKFGQSESKIPATAMAHIKKFELKAQKLTAQASRLLRTKTYRNRTIHARIDRTALSLKKQARKALLDSLAIRRRWTQNI